jgi:hypothetical protein
LNQSLQCTVFNEIDPLDLISELVRASQDEKFKGNKKERKERKERDE